MAKEKVNQWQDEIVEEVRAAREAYARKFDYNLDAMANDLRKKEAADEAKGFKFVSYPPKRPSRLTETHS